MPLVRRWLPFVLALAVSCTSDAAPPDPGGRTSALPRSGGTLRVVMAEDVDALDPQRAAQPSSWGLLRAMHRGLMAFPAAAGEEGSRPVPDLAEAPPVVSPDGLRYEFKLREGVAFGAPASRPLTAADVKAGLERAISVPSPVARPLGVIAGVATPDARTVVISLVRPVNDLLWLLALPATSAVPPGLPPVTPADRISPSGPYRLDDGGYRAERSITLVRNLAWNEDSDPVRSALVDRIEVQIGLSPEEIQARLLDGRADLSGDVPPGELPGSFDARLVRAPNGCLRYLFMNVSVPPFSDGRVRAVVAGMVTRDPIAKSYSGSAVPAAGILPPTVAGHDPGASAPPPNPAAAKAALAAVGLPRGFAATLVAGDRAIDRAHAAAIRAALAPAGIRVTIRTVAIASLYEDHYEVRAARVPMGIATWCADWPGLGGRGALTPLVDGRGLAARGNTNYSGISDRGLHAALDAASVERDPGRAAERWRAADAAARRLVAVVPLAFLSETSLLGPDVRGFVPHPYFLRGDLTAVWLDRP